MKRYTPFELLKKELKIPKEITVDDADGTRLGTNGVYLSDIMAIIEQYARQEVKFISSNLPVSGSFMCAMNSEKKCKKQCFTCHEDEKCDILNT